MLFLSPLSQLSSIQLHLIQGLGNIPQQLLTLGVHRAITSLRVRHFLSCDNHMILLLLLLLGYS